MSLDRIPTEIVEHIASYLDLSSFCSVRLLSTSFNQRTLHAFKKRCFRTRTLKWTKESLDSLHDISASPVFNKALRNLVVDATPQRCLSFWQVHRSRLDGIPGPASDAHWGALLVAELYDQYMTDHERDDEIIKYYNDMHINPTILKVVFQNIEKLDNIMFEYQGMDMTYARFGKQYCQLCQGEMSDPFTSILRAIAKSGIQVANISVNPARQHGAISIALLESLAPFLADFDHAFQTLRVLHVDLRDWRHALSMSELETGKPPIVVQFLAKACYVRDLQVSCYSEFQHDIFDELARGCRFEHLKMCDLSFFEVHHVQDFLDFLKPARRTLQRLYVHKIVLDDEDRTWMDLIRSMLLTGSGNVLQFEDDEGGWSDCLRLGAEDGSVGPWKLREDLASLKRVRETSDESDGYSAAAHAYPFTGSSEHASP